jgi:hypothetical protein
LCCSWSCKTISSEHRGADLQPEKHGGFYNTWVAKEPRLLPVQRTSIFWLSHQLKELADLLLAGTAVAHSMERSPARCSSVTRDGSGRRKNKKEENDHEKNSSYVLRLNQRCLNIVFRIGAALAIITNTEIIDRGRKL